MENSDKTAGDMAEDRGRAFAGAVIETTKMFRRVDVDERYRFLSAAGRLLTLEAERTEDPLTKESRREYDEAERAAQEQVANGQD